MALSTIIVSQDTQIIDLRTGKFTRQGLIILQAIADAIPQINEKTDFQTSVPTTSVRGPVLAGAAVADASSSTVSVDTADASDAAVSYTQAEIQEIVDLANETKADVNTLVTNVNSAITQLNALKASLEASGAMDS